MRARPIERAAVASTVAGFVCAVATVAGWVGTESARQTTAVSAERVAAAAVLRAKSSDREFDVSIRSLALWSPGVAEFDQIMAIRSIESRTGRLPESEQAIQDALGRAMRLGAAKPASILPAVAATSLVFTCLSSILLVSLAISARRRERARIAEQLCLPASSVSTGNFADELFIYLLRHRILSGATAVRMNSRPPEVAVASTLGDNERDGKRFRSTIDDPNDGIGPTGVHAIR